MIDHLSEQSISRYRQKAMEPAELLAADEHLAKCDECYRRIGDPGQLNGGLDSLFAAITETAQDDHLSYEQFEAYVDHELDETGLEIADVHLAVCQQCAEELRQLSDLAAMPALSPGEPSPGPSAWNKLAQFLGWSYQPARFRFATAALVLAMLGTAAWIFWRVSLRARSEVAESSRPAVNAGSPTSTPGSSSSGELQAQAEPTASPGSSPRIVVALNDGGGQVTLDDAGNLIGLPDLPPSYHEAIRSALSTQRINLTPALEGLGGKNGVLMGTSGEGVPFALVNPIGTVVRSDRPTLRWRSLPGAGSYTVKVFDTNFKEIVTSPPQAETTWKVSAPLARGLVYVWQVTAIKNSEEIKSPVAPAPEARFRVLGRDKAVEMERAQRTYAHSHLILGTIYAEAGLVEDAEREFRLLLQGNPGSPVAQKLLQNISRQAKSERGAAKQ